MEIPSQNESHFDIITTGVESEEVEEVNDAYKDILEELGDNMPSLSPVIFPHAGVAAATEGEMEEVIQLVEIVTEESCVICLADGSHMKVEDCYTKVSFLCSHKLFIVVNFVPITRGNSAVLQT